MSGKHVMDFQAVHVRHFYGNRGGRSASLWRLSRRSAARQRHHNKTRGKSTKQLARINRFMRYRPDGALPQLTLQSIIRRLNFLAAQNELEKSVRRNVNGQRSEPFVIFLRTRMGIWQRRVIATSFLPPLRRFGI